MRAMSVLEEIMTTMSSNSQSGALLAGPPGATGGEFDDILIWLSPSILYNRILSGGL